MAKILKNTTASDIDLDKSGVEIPANGQITLSVEEYALFASVDSITELTPFINAGDIVVNDGNNDLSAAEALDFLKFPDVAPNIRFLSPPEKSNLFPTTIKDVQSAIEYVVDLPSQRVHVIPFLQHDTITTAAWLEAGIEHILTNKTKWSPPKKLKIMKIGFSNKWQGTSLNPIIVKITAHYKNFTDTGDISTLDPIEWFVQPTSSTAERWSENGRMWWYDSSQDNFFFETNRAYGIQIQFISGDKKPKEIFVQLHCEESV